jgi:hypothetical protein
MDFRAHHLHKPRAQSPAHDSDHHTLAAPKLMHRYMWQVGDEVSLFGVRI